MLSGSRRRLLLRAIIIGTGAALAGCGGSNPTDPSAGEDLPRVTSNCASGPASAVYMVIGLSSRVVDPSVAPPLEARIQVGETVRVSIQFVGCGYAVDQVWSTTNSRVGVMEPIVYGDPPGVNAALLRALSPGEVSVLAEFRGPDGKRHTATTAYCELDAQYPGLNALAGGCANPKKIEVVRVVP
jgi:hypothetical protein